MATRKKAGEVSLAKQRAMDPEQQAQYLFGAEKYLNEEETRSWDQLSIDEKAGWYDRAFKKYGGSGGAS